MNNIYKINMEHEDYIYIGMAEDVHFFFHSVACGRYTKEIAHELHNVLIHNDLIDINHTVIVIDVLKDNIHAIIIQSKKKQIHNTFDIHSIEMVVTTLLRNKPNDLLIIKYKYTGEYETELFKDEFNRFNIPEIRDNIFICGVNYVIM